MNIKMDKLEELLSLLKKKEDEKQNEENGKLALEGFPNQISNDDHA